MSIQRRRYSQEFKDQLVEEVMRFSKLIAQVAREYGIAAQSLGNWVNKYRATHDTNDADTGDHAKTSAREQQLEAELQELKAEVAFLKRSGRVLRQGSTVVAKYEFIDSLKTSGEKYWSIVNMCAWLAVSRSGFYHWRSPPQPATDHAARG